ncbi:hypothetical protein KSF78_0005999 [Schistosoma japonicum]|nr:hypothetical protein KSF78_0005999 [Schistosoma japonicum]
MNYNAVHETLKHSTMNTTINDNENKIPYLITKEHFSALNTPTNTNNLIFYILLTLKLNSLAHINPWIIIVSTYMKPEMFKTETKNRKIKHSVYFQQIIKITRLNIPINILEDTAEILREDLPQCVLKMKCNNISSQNEHWQSVNQLTKIASRQF